MSSPPPPPVVTAFNNTSPPPITQATNNSFFSPPPPEANGTTPPITNGTAPPPSDGGLPPGTMAGLIVGVVLGAIIVLVGVGIFVIIHQRRKRRMAEGFAGGPPQGPKGDPYVGQHWQQNVPHPTENKPMPTPSGFPSNPQKSPVFVPIPSETHSTSGSSGSEKTAPGIAFGFPQSTFTYDELVRASNGFSDSNLLGQGGFGYVHKGVLPNGKVVAIKQLKAGSGQGEREFQAEVEIISRVHHRHLVSLVGYCITGAQRMLVYEFVPNNTLEFHLHGKERPTMDWATRVKIAVGAAKGLAYLHEDCHPKIIHRDVKAANILLEDNFEAKVADFGLAKYSLDTETHVSTRVMGTFGYMAPEYASTGKLTDKSDVFSFGVVLLELITGHRPVDKNQSFFDDSIVDWARSLLNRALQDGNYDALVDPKLQKSYDCNEMARMIACAAASVRHSAKFRPRMSQIVRALEGNMSLDDLNEGITPGQSTVFGSFAGSDYSSGQYKEDLKKFRKMALESQELGNSGYSGPTSEYGLHASSSSTEGQQTTQEMELQEMEKQTKETS